MPDYIEITEAETDPGAPGTSSLWKRWRDNPIAIAEGSITGDGAPFVAGAWYNLEKQEPTTDVSEIVFAYDINGLRDIEVEFIGQKTGSVTADLHLEIRTAGGTYRQIGLLGQLPATGVLHAVARVANVNDANSTSLRVCSILSAGTIGANFDRTNFTGLIGSGNTTANGGYSSHDEVINEVRLVVASDNIEGTSAGQRAVAILRGRSSAGRDV